MAPDQASPGQPATAAPAEAIRHPLVQFARLLASDAPPFRTEVPPGYKRGIDFYPTAAMPRVLHSAAMQFRKVHGRFPDLVQPRRLSDKVFWSKFFRPLKVPETGNKLLTSSFIPEEAKKLVRCPEIVWHSPAPPIPRNAAVEPGVYYLKANLGADRYRRVTYPMTDAELAALDEEFTNHARENYNIWRGEWWYNAFRPELLLERAIGSAEHTTSWNFYVIGGEVELIVVYQKLDGPDVYRKSYLSPAFEPLDEETPAAAIYELPSEAARERMLVGARAIGAPLGFVRVDFLLDDEETPYLGELTFTPGNGLSRLSNELELRLGRLCESCGAFGPSG